MRECCTLEPHWLPELAPNQFQRADQTKISKRKMRETIEPLSRAGLRGWEVRTDELPLRPVFAATRIRILNRTAEHSKRTEIP